jgi:sugar-phosphatase
MISAVIFDMDGVLIDSEPLWRQSMIKVFSEFGLSVNEEQCKATKGMKIEEVIKKWNTEKKLSWDNKIDHIKHRIHIDLIQRIKLYGKPIEGVMELLDFIRNKMKLKTGLATSSDPELMHAVIEKLNLYTFIDAAVHPNESIRPKPDPDVYMHCAENLNVSPDDCLAIEDSYFGILSAKRAGMRVIGIPESPDETEKFLHVADYVLSSHRDVRILLEKIL